MLTLKNVTKSFNGFSAPVLNLVDLHLNSQDFCIILGSNGSGKSTLMKVISGEYIANSGYVDLHGSYISQVVQDVNKGTISSMTLLENVALSEIYRKKPKFALYHRYKEVVVDKIKELDIGLEKFINQPLNNLSCGQRQIIATLMAIYSGGQILLLDEHTSALDPKMQDLLMQYTDKSVKELGLTAMMITHKMHDAIQYGNRLIMLHKGKIVEDISGIQKAKLTVHDLINLFHKYEDKNLLGELCDN